MVPIFTLNNFRELAVYAACEYELYFFVEPCRCESRGDQKRSTNSDRKVKYEKERKGSERHGLEGMPPTPVPRTQSRSVGAIEASSGDRLYLPGLLDPISILVGPFTQN
ncbi:unnamed protein product [Mesocestoides corti]|uniref:Uncharacterized protein n=1 Tax=Mesocestoides corti TaxID=53468 RepID=A0A0R3U264_MESCO|nr:unnamed protein product [Mesocestoides corti]